MAHTLAKLLAVVVNSCGIFIFRNTQGFTPCYGAPWLASIMFAFSLYFFLKDFAYFPMSFCKVHIGCLFMLEFLFTIFVVEWAVLDFWYTLQYATIRGLQKFPAMLVKLTRFELFKYLLYGVTSKFGVMIINYVLSGFFLICALQGTRSVDFQLLRCGAGVFYKEAQVNFKKGAMKLWPYTGPRFPSIKLASRRKWAYR